MFKRILKIFGICMAILVVVIGLGVGIFALKGGFKTTVINIIKLYMDDSTKSSNEIYILNDTSVLINFEPLNATNRELEVLIQDPLRIEHDGILETEGVLKNVPKTIQAGNIMNLEINKDDKGNNIGGVVTLTFRPKNDNKSITDFTLKVIVDVAIPNNSLYFAGNVGDTNGSDEFSPTGKKIAMGISNSEQFIYLKSELVNAFYLQANNQNMKDAKISYVYTDLKDNEVEKKSFHNLTCERIYNPETKQYNYYYKVPITPSVSGKVTLKAQMHRTYEIEKEYSSKENDFDRMPYVLSTPEDQAKLTHYNDFINKYIQFFDTSEESYAFFKSYITNDGRVSLPLSQVERSKDFVFQTCTTTIEISALNLKGITSTIAGHTYKVFDSEEYTLKKIISSVEDGGFDLNITLDEENVANIDTEKANLFGTLKVTPFIYVSYNEFTSNSSLWKGYGFKQANDDGTDRKYILAVNEFKDKKPVDDENFKVYLNDDGSLDGSYECMGFLIPLDRTDIDYNDYITMTASNDASNKYWKFDFNVPLKEIITNDMNEVNKALYFRFDVKGRNLQTNEEKLAHTYSRVYIDYTDYNYYDAQNSTIAVNDLKDMILNTNVQNVNSIDKYRNKYVSTLNKQNVDVNLSSVINNYNQVEYKSIMYFVEESSNNENSFKKVATIGKYKFRYMNAGVDGDDLVKLNNDNLIGERLLFTGSIKDPRYYIQAINASTTPVKVFAVVYLSDKNGNPIDIYGRPIEINETAETDTDTTLVVFAITNLNSMQSFNIDNFVDNMNFYTIASLGDQNEVKITQGDDAEGDLVEYVIQNGDFVKRNNITNYANADGFFDEDHVKQLQDLLTLKLLYKLDFELIATNFNLDNKGEILEDQLSIELSFNSLKDSLITRSYSINTVGNKQLALNYMSNNWKENNTYNYKLNISATNESNAVSDPVITYVDDSENVKYLTFTINAEGKNGGDTDYIYIRSENEIDALSSKQEYVSWCVNTLKVVGVNLCDADKDNVLNELVLDQYQKLHAVHSSSVKNGMQFGILSNNYNENYSLPFDKESAYLGSIYDNIIFDVTSNIYNSEDSLFGNLNSNIIDLSQLDQTDEQVWKYFYNTNNISITYLNAEGFMRLENDLVFDSQGQSNCIYIGNTEYDIYSGAEKYVIIEGRKYLLESDGVDGYTLTIKAGEIFPYVTYNGEKLLLMLGQEFNVYNRIVGNSERCFISSIENHDTGNYREVEVKELSRSEYNPQNYIDDKTTGSASERRYSAITHEYENGKLKDLKVNFVNGGIEFVEDIDGEYKFVKDPNGPYQLSGENGYFVKISAGENVAQKYSMQGAKAFMVITFNDKLGGMTFQKPIYKVLTYELVEEKIVLMASKDGQQTLLTSDSSTSEFEIPANSEITIKLDTIQSTSGLGNNFKINLINSSGDAYFFKHCTFSTDAGSAVSIKSIVDGSSITLETKSLYADESTRLIISYMDHGNRVDKILNLKIIADYDLKLKENNSLGCQQTNDYYLFRLNSNGEGYDISNLISECFVAGESSKNDIEFVIKESTAFANIVGGKLQIGPSYAYLQGDLNSSNPTIVRDYIELEIRLKNKVTHNYYESFDDDHKIKPLRIEINPIYTFDLRKLTESNENNISINILNGQILYDPELITFYNGASYDSSNIINANYYETLNAIFKLSEIGYYEDGEWKTNESPIDLLHGKVAFDGEICNTGIHQYKLRLAYNEGIDGASEEYHEFYVNVVGYDVYFSDSVDLRGVDFTNAENREAYKFDNESKTLQFAVGDTLDMDQLFQVRPAGDVELTIPVDLHVVLLRGTKIVANINELKASDFDLYNIGIAYSVTGGYKFLRDLGIYMTISDIDED